MPNMLDSLLSWAAHQRGFVLGPDVVDWADQWQGTLIDQAATAQRRDCRD